MAMEFSRPNSACSSVDFEAELDQFFIRNLQGGVDKDDTASTRKTFEFIPLMLSDALKCVESQKQNIFHAFNGTVAFRSFVLHACVVGRCAGSANFHKYYIDDGTAVAQLDIYKKSKEILTVLRLQHQVDALKATQVNDRNYRDSLNCLCRLLAHTKQQMDLSDISVGSKIFVQGRVKCYRGNTRIQSFSVYVDAQRDRSMEIAFKDHLIDWYAHKYPAMGVKL